MQMGAERGGAGRSWLGAAAAEGGGEGKGRFGGGEGLGQREMGWVGV